MRNLFDNPLLLLVVAGLLFALFVAALVDVLRRDGLDGVGRLVWVVVLLFLPVLGPVLWFALRSRVTGPGPTSGP